MANSITLPAHRHFNKFWMAGIVAEENPYDKLQLTATIGTTDPLFQQKRALLQRHNLATQQSFDIYMDRVRSHPQARESWWHADT